MSRPTHVNAPAPCECCANAGSWLVDHLDPHAETLTYAALAEETPATIAQHLWDCWLEAGDPITRATFPELMALVSSYADEHAEDWDAEEN